MGILIAYLLGILTSFKPKNYDAAHNSDSSDATQRQWIPPKSDKERSTKEKRARRKTILFWVQIGTMILLFVYSGITFLIWCSARDSAELSRRQLEMMDRPWIRDTVTPAFDLMAQNGAFSWAVTVKADNIGHSVATSVFPRTELIAPQGADFIDGPRKRVTELCENAARRATDIKKDTTLWNSSVFPGNPVEYPQSPILWPKDVEKSTVDGGEKLGKSISLMLVGCIVYGYPTALKFHETGFVYLVIHKDDETIPEPSQVFFSIGKTIPKDKLVMIKKGEFAD